MFTIVGYGRADWTLYRLAPLWKVMILAEGRSQNKHSLQVLAGNLALLIKFDVMPWTSSRMAAGLVACLS